MFKDQNGDKAIDFKLKTLDGKEVSLSDLKGKNIFINFWATWCPYCVQEMPEIEKLYQETKNSDLIILGIDIGEDNA
ncbi:TlpA disulfide reductase family protein [Clostridium zeae]|uniref:TlpA disulfide reductase family protein n=1 Tax=Clostridium zeae TaxID=2759022 RepID=UPI001A8C99F8|nr:TlpA disulfide reductase family protein [Clostridium zeae]